MGRISMAWVAFRTPVPQQYLPSQGLASHFSLYLHSLLSFSIDLPPSELAPRAAIAGSLRSWPQKVRRQPLSFPSRHPRLESNGRNILVQNPMEEFFQCRIRCIQSRPICFRVESIQNLLYIVQEEKIQVCYRNESDFQCRIRWNFQCRIHRISSVVEYDLPPWMTCHHGLIMVEIFCVQIFQYVMID